MAAAASGDASHVKMTGKWKPNIARSDDFEPFMAYVGVPWLVRKAVKRSAPVMELAITEKTFHQTTSGAMGKKFVNEGPFGTEIDWNTPGGTSRIQLDLTDEGTIVLNGASPNAKDPKGTLRSTYSLQEDDSIEIIMHVVKGNGEEIRIRRILERV